MTETKKAPKTTSHWNYRLMKRKINGKLLYAMHEVYYDEHGKVNGWTETPITPYHELKRDVITELRKMMVGAKQPILNYDKDE
jgi:hypothetical protein